MYYSWKTFLWVEWFCNTRQQDRVFRVDRILKMITVEK
jgi:predicted DNA-binding transcriptional regulator YafY